MLLSELKKRGDNKMNGKQISENILAKKKPPKTNNKNTTAVVQL